MSGRADFGYASSGSPDRTSSNALQGKMGLTAPTRMTISAELMPESSPMIRRADSDAVYPSSQS